MGFVRCFVMCDCFPAFSQSVFDRGWTVSWHGLKWVWRPASRVSFLLFLLFFVRCFYVSGGPGSRVAGEFLEAAREALASGRVRAAALLACTGLEAAGLADEGVRKLRDAVLAGWTPDAGEVKGLLDRLGGAIGGVEEGVIVEVDLTVAGLTVLGVVLLALMFLEVFPAWVDALLIPSSAVAFLGAFFRGWGRRGEGEAS